VPQALSLAEVAELMAGRALDLVHRPDSLGGTKKNYFTTVRGAL